MQPNAAQFSAIWHKATQCGARQRYLAHCSAMQRKKKRCITIWHKAPRWSAAPRSKAQRIRQHSTMQRNEAQVHRNLAHGAAMKRTVMKRTVMKRTAGQCHAVQYNICSVPLKVVHQPLFDVLHFYLFDRSAISFI
jgi:hypothetical protein